MKRVLILVSLYLTIVLSNGCDRYRTVPFGNKRTKEIPTKCGAINLQLRSFGSSYNLSIITESATKIHWETLKIVVGEREVQYRMKWIDDHPIPIYKFTIPYAGESYFPKEEEILEITFIANHFVQSETDTCGFGPITVRHTR